MYLDKRLRPLYVEPNGRFEESTLLVRANIGLRIHTALTLCLLSYLFEEPTLLEQHRFAIFALVPCMTI